ncbi:MAG: polysaccharide deacetylase family protein [Erysipelotrichaceae bacterium]|nr:polysaccharide deacetylase family protein [Erysipelotrichaceae bacterium]
MEEKGSAVKRGAGIVFSVLLLLSIGALGYAIFTLNTRIDENELLYVENEKLIASETIALNDKLTDKDVLMKEKDEIENFNTTLASYHDEFFRLAMELEEKVTSGQSDKKIAYLTFDDGPYRMSYKFLDILDEYDVPATFFYLKKCAEEGFRDEWIYDEVYRRVLRSGHTLGNHSASHQLKEDSIYSSVERFMNDIEDNRKFILDRYGYTTEVMRFPGGTGTAGSRYYGIVEELRKIHYAWVDWNSATGDGGMILSPAEYRDNVLNNTGDKKLLVVLMHDYSENTLAALPEIIEGLSDQGYVFLPLFYESQAVNR